MLVMKGKVGWGMARARVLWCIVAVGLVAADFAAPPAGAQESTDTSTSTQEVFAEIPPRLLVDIPTAGLLPPASFETRVRAYPGGGVEGRLDVGLPWRINIGASYGGLQIIGDGDPEWNPHLGLSAKIRIAEETYSTPAFALGVDTQGSGFYDKDLSRYQFKSRGVYAIASKNYAWLGNFTMHGGMSRSLEDQDDGDPTIFGGFDKSLGPYAGVVLEYDAALNDNKGDGVYGRGRGYLNAAFRVSLATVVEVRFVLRDLLRNTESEEAEFSDVVVDEGVGREFHLSYRVEY
jgi:hypothetical protein